MESLRLNSYDCLFFTSKSSKQSEIHYKQLLRLRKKTRINLVVISIDEVDGFNDAFERGIENIPYTIIKIGNNEILKFFGNMSFEKMCIEIKQRI